MPRGRGVPIVAWRGAGACPAFTGIRDLATATILLDNVARDLLLRNRLERGDLDLWADLPWQVRSFAAGDTFVREGDRPLYCAVLLSGFACRQKLTGDGLRQIIAIHLPGEAVDFQNLYLDVADHTVQMLTSGQMAVVRQNDLRRLLARHLPLAQAVMNRTMVDASIFRDWVLNLGRRKARERLAHLLCEVAFRLEMLGLVGVEGYHLPMTQEELGDALGLTPVHVNRTLRTLEAEGLIARRKRRIEFPQWRRMVELGDFNPRYLHVGEPQPFA